MGARMIEPTIEQLKDDLKSLKIVGGSQEAREAFWRLLDNYARTARLANALDAQLQQEREGREKLGKVLEDVHTLLTNLQPHIPQACIPGRGGFIDNYVSPALELARAALQPDPQAQAGEGL